MSVPPVGGQLDLLGRKSNKYFSPSKTEGSVLCFIFSQTGNWRLSLGLVILLSVIELCSMTKLPGLAAQHPP